MSHKNLNWSLSIFKVKIFKHNYTCRGLRHYAKSQKVAVLTPDEVIGFFFSINVILPAALWPGGRLSL
jgi:hypothetical protein